MQQELNTAIEAGHVASTGKTAPGRQSFPMQHEPAAAAGHSSVVLQGDARAIQDALHQQKGHLIQGGPAENDVLGAIVPGALSDDDISIGGTPPSLPPPQVRPHSL
jgi:hypothetical protein